MKIHLPNSAFLGNIDPFIRSFDASDPEQLEITANEKWISIHPVVLAMTAAIGLKIDPSKIYVKKLKAKSAHYIERMGLFSLLKVDSGITIAKHEPAGRFIPLTQIKDSLSLTKFITEMVPLLHLDPKHAEPIKYIISELCRNVLEHSRSEYGAIICAQYYKTSNRISIGIVDSGVGIKKTINNAYPAKDDLAAIQLALTPGITGTTKKEGGTESNAGAGLFFVKSIAYVNKDYFMIYSGNGLYKLLTTQYHDKKDSLILNADPFKDKHSKNNNYPYWQGTIVGIDLSLSATEEFSLLLDHIRTTYGKAVRERKKERRMKARFIE